MLLSYAFNYQIYEVLYDALYLVKHENKLWNQTPFSVFPES